MSDGRSEAFKAGLKLGLYSLLIRCIVPFKQIEYGVYVLSTIFPKPYSIYLRGAMGCRGLFGEVG